MPWKTSVGNRIITIDGPAGTGKSTVAKGIAERLGFIYLDTGALYRAAALKISSSQINPDNEEDCARVISTSTISICGDRTFIDGKDVSEEIRSSYISDLASRIATLQSVRKELISIQRSIALLSSIVAEGRDMGSVVFPDADVKFFLDAIDRERARRRYLELLDKGYNAEFKKVLTEIRRRDSRDKTRKISPLVIPKDAIVVDTTHLTREQVLSKLLEIIRLRLSD